MGTGLLKSRPHRAGPGIGAPSGDGRSLALVGGASAYPQLPGRHGDGPAGGEMQSAISRLYLSVYSGEPIQDPFVHARDAIRFRHAAESHRCASEITIQVSCKWSERKRPVSIRHGRASSQRAHRPNQGRAEPAPSGFHRMRGSFSGTSASRTEQLSSR